MLATAAARAFPALALICALIPQAPGVGFAATYKDEIFEPFRRLRGRSDFPGAGIGLAICKTVADSHGWRPVVESTQTMGATFEIVFPKSDDRGSA